MGKTRDLFKNIRNWYFMQTFHAKMGSIKDRNGMDLTEAEDIKKRWQEYTEELYNVWSWRTGFHDPDNHDGVITHLEPEFLDCQVTWALGSITTIKASGSDGIPLELFQIVREKLRDFNFLLCSQKKFNRHFFKQHRSQIYKATELNTGNKYGQIQINQKNMCIYACTQRKTFPWFHENAQLKKI